jgi:hypothetical protein
VNRLDNFKRLLSKGLEGQFIWELEHGFELSPKESTGILDTVKLYFSQSQDYNFGKVQISVACQEEPPGKLITEIKKKLIWVTLDAGVEDIEILEKYNSVYLRRIRILRVVEEILDGGGVATQEDLARLFQVDVRTIRRDISYLRGVGYEVTTRGEYCDIGKGVSHRVLIVEKYLEGLTYSEICRVTRHSAKSVKRYINTFIRVATLLETGVERAKEIAFYVGISERLAKSYIELYHHYNSDVLYQKRIKELTRQIVNSTISSGEKKVCLEEKV